MHGLSLDNFNTVNPENYAEIIFAFYFYTESNFYGSGHLYY